jgi:hypothetical protein
MLEKRKDPETVADWLQLDLDPVETPDVSGKKRVCSLKI